MKLGGSEVDHAAIATRATHMVEKLSAENQSLRHDLDRMKIKVIKLEKVNNSCVCQNFVRRFCKKKAT